jgi:hypothetical protein
MGGGGGARISGEGTQIVGGQSYSEGSQNRLNMELDLLSLYCIWAPVYTAVLVG